MFTDLDAFLTAKSAAGLSAKTLTWYSMFVCQYLEWAESQNLPNKKPETVEAFLTSLRLQGRSAFTIAGCYRALSVYFKWLVQRKRLRTSPMTYIQSPSTPKQRKRHVTASEFRQLYKSIDGERWVDHRDRAILLVLFYTGLRSSELLALKAEDVDRGRSILRVNSGKGNQDRDVPFADFLLEQLDAYLAVRPPYPSKILFVSQGGPDGTARGPLTYNGLKEITRRRCKAAGMKRLGLHSFRHGYAMLFLNEGEMELDAISQSMGHSSLDITRRFYADYVTTSLRRQYSRALDRIGAIV